MLNSNSIFEENYFSRTIKDSIYEKIEFESNMYKFIDTVEFQRTRNIKQLGNVFLVCPGATHTRFDHSLGTAFLSSKLVNDLSIRISEIYKPSNMEMQTVALAGLLHDIGHGPFSHLFDKMVIRKLQ